MRSIQHDHQPLRPSIAPSFGYHFDKEFLMHYEIEAINSMSSDAMKITRELPLMLLCDSLSKMHRLYSMIPENIGRN